MNTLHKSFIVVLLLNFLLLILLDLFLPLDFTVDLLVLLPLFVNLGLAVNVLLLDPLFGLDVDLVPHFRDYRC